MTTKKWLLIVGGIIASGTMVLVWLWLVRPIIPLSVRKQISFVIFYPGKANSARLNRASFKYDESGKILTYTANIGGTKLTVTNQATPETFTDIPQVYDKVVEGMHSYASFDGSSGKVSLTRPPNAGNQQVAVVNTQGTLMFVRADHDLSDDQWRKFFNNLSTIK